MQKKSVINEEERKALREIVDSIEIEILDEYKNEIDSHNKTKKFDYMIILYGAIIGSIAGVISYLIGLLVTKKKSSK